MPRRFAFVATHSRWTAFFSNGFLGTDAAGAMSVLAGRLGCKGMRVVSVDQTLPSKPARTDEGDYGSVQWEVYGKDGKTLRTIFSANDGGKWKFGESGVAFPFEEAEAYSLKSIRARFTEEMLSRYLKHFDAEPFCDKWYTNTAMIVHRSGVPPYKIIER
jgi:hypothetical protein